MTYSPKIRPELIPVLYRTARARTTPMTRLVDRLLLKALAVESLPSDAVDLLQPYSMFFTQAQQTSVSTLDELIASHKPLPFRQGWEVEAWYHGCVHGLSRAVALHREETMSGMNSVGSNELLHVAQQVRDQCLLFLPESKS